MKENSHLYDFTEQYFKENNVGHRKWNYFRFYANEFIPIKMLENARRAYARYETDKEIPILLIDDAVFYRGKRGMLITNINIYYRLFPVDVKNSNGTGKIQLNDTEKMVLLKIMNRAWVLINNHKVGTLASVGGPPEGRIGILNDYFGKLLQAIHQNPYT